MKSGEVGALFTKSSVLKLSFSV
uniref:Uncharacterized protein n=1 Tax=Rhizophora mucronata TaxID=61149 RepID=A0A2P2P016_RHIMU